MTTAPLHEVVHWTLRTQPHPPPPASWLLAVQSGSLEPVLDGVAVTVVDDLVVTVVVPGFSTKSQVRIQEMEIPGDSSRSGINSGCSKRETLRNATRARCFKGCLASTTRDVSRRIWRTGEGMWRRRKETYCTSTLSRQKMPPNSDSLTISMSWRPVRKCLST